VEDFADNFPIGNDDAGPVRMQQRGRKNIDGHDIAMHAKQRDVLAYPVRFRKNNR
jgi:hypothetical protein